MCYYYIHYYFHFTHKEIDLLNTEVKQHIYSQAANQWQS